MAMIVDTAPETRTSGDSWSRFRRPIGTAALGASVLFAGFYVASLSTTVTVWNWLTGDGSATRLRWLMALLPGAIILNQVIYVASSRRKQFREALGPLAEDDLRRLEGLYFGYGSLTIRYMVPATGAMDLAWYRTSPGSIKPLADDIRMPEALLRDVVARLSQDAHVLDLYKLYWDPPRPSLR